MTAAETLVKMLDTELEQLIADLSDELKSMPYDPYGRNHLRERYEETLELARVVAKERGLKFKA